MQTQKKNRLQALINSQAALEEVPSYLSAMPCEEPAMCVSLQEHFVTQKTQNITQIPPENQGDIVRAVIVKSKQEVACPRCMHIWTAESLLPVDVDRDLSREYPHLNLK